MYCPQSARHSHSDVGHVHVRLQTQHVERAPQQSGVLRRHQNADGLSHAWLAQELELMPVVKRRDLVNGGLVESGRA